MVSSLQFKAQEVEIGNFPRATWPAGPAISVCSRLTRDPASKNKVEGRWEKILIVNLRSLHEHTHRCTHMPAHMQKMCA